MSAEDQELSRLLKDFEDSGPRPSPKRRRPRSFDDYGDEDGVVKGDGSFCQWTSTDNTKYFPAGKTFDVLGPALWEPKYCGNRGYYCEKLPFCTDGLLEFPDSNSERVVKEIQRFWEFEEEYRRNGLAYKRGIILWGPPGSGKSSTIKLILKDVFQRGGIAMKFDCPHVFLEVVRIFRTIEPNTPLVVLMEDIDAIIDEWGETDVLNILDGVEVLEKVVYLATTNYPEKLGERIINRPSRFDRRFKMPHPSKKSRRLYFEHLLQTNKELNIDLDRWVRDTEEMSIAHLKELFIAVCILGNDYKVVLDTLISMKEDRLTSTEDDNSFGFAPYKKEED